MVNSGKVHAKEYFPELLLPVSLYAPPPHLYRRPSNTIREVWFSVLWGHCSFPWVLMCTLHCVCPSRVESLFPPVLSKSCSQILLAFKVWFSRNSSFRCWTPRLGSLTWGLEPSLQWVNFCGISVLLFVSHPPSSYGIWFYCECTPPTVSLWLLLCLWMWRGIFFGDFQCLPFDDFSTVSCDSSALTRGSEHTSFYSAILNQSLQLLIIRSCPPFCTPYLLQLVKSASSGIYANYIDLILQPSAILYFIPFGKEVTL